MFLIRSRKISTLDFFYNESSFERKQIFTVEILVKKSCLAKVRKAFLQFENQCYLMCIYLFIYLFNFRDKVSPQLFGSCPGTSSCRPALPRSHRDPPASASRVLGLKACTTTAPNICLVLKYILLFLLAILYHLF